MVNRSLNVLVVDEELPYPLLSGKRIRTYQLLRHLSKSNRITFLCHKNADPNERRLASREFERLGIKVEFLKRSLPPQTLSMPKLRLFWELLRNLPSPLPYFVQKQVSGELGGRLAAIVERDDVDLVHFEWTPYAAGMVSRVRKPWVIDAHNVESLIWRRYFEVEENWGKKAFIHDQWKKTLRFERRMLENASHTVFVSQPDQEIARVQLGCKSSSVVDNGVDVTAYEFSERHAAEGTNFLFLGSLDWRPNVDAVNYLLNEIWPSVVERFPDARLNIVGRNPNQALANRILVEANCALHANAPEVKPFLASAAAMVVPLRIGGGSRLKVLEAAAAGLPVISSRIGVEGLELEEGSHYILADTSEQMVTSMRAVCQPDRIVKLMEMTKAARSVVENRYEWSFLARKLEHVWRDEVARFSLE